MRWFNRSFKLNLQWSLLRLQIMIVPLDPSNEMIKLTASVVRVVFSLLESINIKR